MNGKDNETILLLQMNRRRHFIHHIKIFLNVLFKWSVKKDTTGIGELLPILHILKEVTGQNSANDRHRQEELE